jgi:hypothetical protein
LNLGHLYFDIVSNFVLRISYFAGLHILMPAIPDGPADAGRRLCRYWYRESRCQVRTGWQKLCALCGYKSVKICVNPWLMNYLCAYKAPFCAFLRPTRTVFSRLLKKAVSMALWTKASLFSYITPSFRPQMARYASRFTRYELCSFLEQVLPRTPSWQKHNLC